MAFTRRQTWCAAMEDPYSETLSPTFSTTVRCRWRHMATNAALNPPVLVKVAYK